MSKAVIFDGIRSPFGRHGGVLAGARPDDLAASLIRHLIEKNQIPDDAIEDVVMGDTNQAGEDSRNVARHAALLAGLSVSVAGITVNRLCGSGLAALADAARATECDQGKLFIAGGVESMSRAPWVMAKAGKAYSRNQPVEDSTLGSRFPNPALTEQYGNPSMVQTADNIAADMGISREASDQFALDSQIKRATAQSSGFFADEVLEISIDSGDRGQAKATVAVDEHPRPDSTLEKLSSLKPLQTGGVVTAGNSSGINDGAAVLLVGDEAAGRDIGLEPRARILSAAVAGVEPRVMGLGPVPASRKALERANLTIADMDVIEINEAFATQVLGCTKLMGIDPEDERLNPNGGAIALGHPLGASGARLTLTATRQLQQTSGKYALVSMCIGVGQGIAVVLERLN